MGYFQGIVASSFKQDEQGREIFYSHGIFGKGYIIPPGEIERLKNNLTKFYMAGLGAIIASVCITTGPGPILVGALFIVPYEIIIRRYVKNFEPSTERLRSKDSTTSSARAHSLPLLILMSLCSLAFVIIGLTMITRAASTGATLSSEMLIALGCTGFFGLCFWKITQMAIIKMRS